MPELNSYEERREQPRYLDRLPLDYWETLDLVQGGLLANISDRGLLFHSVHKMQIGAKLGVRVYLLKEYSLDQVEGSGKIVWMNPHQGQDWQGYKYGFHIVQMASNDRERLIRYYLKLQEEGNFLNGERPFDNYGHYISALSNRRREDSLTERGLRIANDILHWLKN